MFKIGAFRGAASAIHGRVLVQGAVSFLLAPATTSTGRPDKNPINREPGGERQNHANDDFLHSLSLPNKGLSGKKFIPRESVMRIKSIIGLNQNRVNRYQNIFLVL
jgi:hypothetical protein